MLWLAKPAPAQAPCAPVRGPTRQQAMFRSESDIVNTAGGGHQPGGSPAVMFSVMCVMETQQDQGHGHGYYSMPSPFVLKHAYNPCGSSAGTYGVTVERSARRLRVVWHVVAQKRVQASTENSWCDSRG